MPVGTTAFPTALDTATELIRVVNAASNTIGVGGVTNVATTVPVTSTTAAPADGVAWCGTEAISYTGKTGTSLTGCVRGFDGTTAASHSAGDPIYFAPIIAAHHRVLSDALIAIETLLGANGVNVKVGGSTTQVQFNDGGAFGGDAGCTYDKTTDALTVVGPITSNGTLLLLSSGPQINLQTAAASQQAQINFNDQATQKWSFYKTPGNDWAVWNNALSHDALKIQIADSLVVIRRLNVNSDALVGTFSVFGTAGVTTFFNSSAADSDTQFKGLTDANLLFFDASTDSIGSGTNTPTSWFDHKAGTASRAPLRIPSGTVLTTPIAGVVENDGASLTFVANTTSKRGDVVLEHTRALLSAGSAIGPAIADFFGATSSIDLPASSLWEMEAVLHFLKTTADTVTITVTNSNAWTSFSGQLEIDAVGGGTGFQTITRANIHAGTAAAQAFPATASLTTGTNHTFYLKCQFQMSASGGNVRIRVTSGTGTVTPGANSFYKLRRLTTQGSFVA